MRSSETSMATIFARIGGSRTSGQPRNQDDRAALIALAQGIFCLVTGIWPLASIRSFEAVTGPKADRWLVKTAGVLITAIGAALRLAGWRKSVTPELRLLAIGSALGLAGIDVVYVVRGRIAKVYLLDALAELGLIAAWALSRSGGNHSPSSSPLSRAEQRASTMFRSPTSASGTERERMDEKHCMNHQSRIQLAEMTQPRTMHRSSLWAAWCIATTNEDRCGCC